MTSAFPLLVFLALGTQTALAIRSTNQLDDSKWGDGEGPTVALQFDERDPGSAKEKIDAIWEKIIADDDVAAPMPSKLAPLQLMSYASQIPLIGHVISWFGLVEDLSTTFSWRKDHPLPPKHTKLIHPVGSVAKVSLVWDDEVVKKLGYTGVFAERQDNVLLRAGPAGALKDTGMAPGIGVKVFRDDQESVNTLMLYSLRGQQGFSHFKHTLCNKLSDFDNKSFAEDLLLKSFKMASKYPFTTGLSQWAEDRTKAHAEFERNFPFVLCFRPVDDVRREINVLDDFKFKHIQEQLFLLTPETKIYEIYAASEPRVEPIKIGDVVMETKFHRTKFGDQQLFFRHDKFENDLEFKPKWLKSVDDDNFWLEEGAANFYKTIDPGHTGGAPRYAGGNAWIGFYDPPTAQDLVKDAAHFSPGSMLQHDGGEGA